MGTGLKDTCNLKGPLLARLGAIRTSKTIMTVVAYNTWNLKKKKKICSLKTASYYMQKE